MHSDITIISACHYIRRIYSVTSDTFNFIHSSAKVWPENSPPTTKVDLLNFLFHYTSLRKPIGPQKLTHAYTRAHAHTYIMPNYINNNNHNNITSSITIQTSAGRYRWVGG